MTPDTAIITASIYLLGITTVALSLSVAWVFFKQGRLSENEGTRQMSKALAWQLAGEAAIGAGTLAFAYAAHTGALAEWSLARQSALRFAMFVATSGTTVHLFSVIKNIR